MEPRDYKLLEMLLIVVAVLGFAFRELWLLRRDRIESERRRAAEEDERRD